MGLRNQFLVVIMLVSMVTLGVLGFLSYKFSQAEALQEAHRKVEILASYIKSSHSYAIKTQIPMTKQLVGKDRFYPELMSIFVMTRNTAETFKKEQPGYTIKNAAVDPLWKANKANAMEMRVINGFKADSGLGKSTGIIKNNGQDFYYQATPMKVKKKCLKCHGDPLNAPKDQVMIYGTENGYHWKLNDVVSAMFIYVPVTDAMKAAQANAIKLVAIGGGCLAAAIIVLVIFLSVKVVSPIAELSRKAEDISLGKNLEKTVSVSPNLEIGQLSRAVDRLRMSIARFMRR